MKLFTRKPLFVLVITFITVFVSCSSSLNYIKPEYNLTKFKEENFEIEQLGEGKILIYNGADILHELTGRLNIWINSKPLAQLKLNEYVIINLEDGIYEFKVKHIDVVGMNSNHEIVIDRKTKVIRIEPTVFSNKVKITNQLPKKFDLFNYSYVE